MNRPAWRIIAGIITISSGLLCLTPRLQAMEDAILAVVNDEVITVKDLHAFLDSRYAQMRLEGKPLSEVQSAMQELQINGLQALIDDKIILTAANKKGVEILPEALNKRMEEIKARYATEKEFKDALIMDGNSISDLQKRIEDQLKIKYLVEEQVRSKIYINPQEVTEFFQQHQNTFNKPERIELDSIFISYGKDPQATKTQAETALAEIQGGKGFKEVATAYSKTPSIGIITKGQMISKIEDTVFSLKENEVSPMIETDTGVYIFKALKHFPAESASLEEVKEKVNQIIFQQKYHQQFQKWLDKLKTAAYIEYKETVEQ